MNIKKMGSFLKELRKEKGLTQEQLAEILGVAGRTVSRWETASNMPDLGMLIQLSELYGVDINEIIDGERKNMPMHEENKENKETLSKIAEYSKLEKEKAVKSISIAYYVTIIASFIAFIVQRILYDDYKMAIGELLIFAVGTAVATALISHQGLWETFLHSKVNPLIE